MKMEIYSVTEVLGKYVDWGAIPDQVLADACKRGNEVHSACGTRALGGYVRRLPGDYAGYYESFCRWFEANVVETILVEKRFTSRALGFTGQLDFLFRLNSGELALVDIKTAAAEGKTWRCQLSAYDSLLANAGFTTDALISLRPRKNGAAAIGRRYESDRAANYNLFLSALNAHRGIIGG